MAPTVLLGTLLSLGGCDGPEPDPESDSIAFEATDVHVLGTSAAIAEVVDLTVRSDGSVWIVNSVEPFLVGFGPDGEILDQYGRQGGGPEEFGAPSGFLSGGDAHEAWVLDPRRHRLMRVPPGPGALETTLPEDSLPPGSLQGGVGMMSPEVRSAALGDEIVLARSFGTLRSGPYSFWTAIWGADLVAVEPLSGSTRTLFSLIDVLGDPSTDYLVQTNGFPPLPLWLRLWTVCADDEIWVHDRRGNSVRTFSADGSDLDTIPLPPPRFDEVTTEQFARAVFGLRAAEVAGSVGVRLTPSDSARVFQEIVQMIDGTPDRLARFMPRYVDMRCSDDGAAWLQPVDLASTNLQGERTWLRVARGVPAREVHMPDRFDPYRFREGRVWGVQRDEFDVATVGWIDLPPGL